MKKNIYSDNINIKNSILHIFHILKKNSKKKFLESVDVSINLNIKKKYLNQLLIYNTVLYPYNLGKNKKIAVFTSNVNKEDFYKAGAYVVGFNTLKKNILKKNIKFNILLSTPDYVQELRELGSILGPRNLIPNNRLGTLTDHLLDSIKKFLCYQVIYKNDKYGIIHTIIGTIKSSSKHLYDNLICLINSVKNYRYWNNKYIPIIDSIYISSTMGKSYHLKINV